LGDIAKARRLAHGVQAGDRVAIWAPNLHEWIVAACGIHAAAAAGFHPGLRSAADAMTGIDATYSPDPAAHARYCRVFEAYRGIYPGLKSTFRQLEEAER
jgi:sugar (pentulose or hexulose) kinase